MSVKKNSNLYEQVRKAVHCSWDPIGIANYSNGIGEYDGYIPALCDLIDERVDRDRLFEYLWRVETESMGLTGDRGATEEFASWLHLLVEPKD